MAALDIRSHGKRCGRTEAVRDVSLLWMDDEQVGELNPRLPFPWLAFLLGVLSACRGIDTRPVALPPVRSSLLDDTATTTARGFELELGLFSDPDDRFESSGTLKWGATERFEVFAAWFPFLVSFPTGEDLQGHGNAELGVRHRFVDETEERPGILGGLNIVFPLGEDDVRAHDGPAFGTTFTLTKSLAGIGFNPTWSVLFQEDSDGSGVDVAHTFGILASAPVREHWFAFLEVAGFLVPSDDIEELLVQAGAGWLPSPLFAWDFGLLVGHGDDAPDLALTTGFTWTPTRNGGEG